MIFQDFSKTFKDCLHFQSLEFAACKFKYFQRVSRTQGYVVGIPAGRWSR